MPQLPPHRPPQPAPCHTLQEYLDAQLALLARLKDPDSQRAVVNADNEAAAAAVAACGGLPVVTYGINSPAADVRVESLELTLWQTTVRLHLDTHACMSPHAAAPASHACQGSAASLCAVPRAGRQRRQRARWLQMDVPLPTRCVSCRCWRALLSHARAPAASRAQMIVATPVGRLEIITNLVGRHNVYNVLAAVAVGVLLNVPLADIGAGIESVQVVPGRCAGAGMQRDAGTSRRVAHGLAPRQAHASSSGCAECCCSSRAVRHASMQRWPPMPAR